MQKESKIAWIICLIVTIIVALGVFLGIFFHKSFIIAFSMLPAVIYEVYRTKGFFTKLASILSLVVVIAEVYVIITGTTVNLSKYMGNYVKELPWLGGDIHAGLIGPVLLVIFSIVLLRRTAGIYTRWLSIIILISSVALFYSINPTLFKGFLKSPAVQENIKQGVKRTIR